MMRMNEFVADVVLSVLIGVVLSAVIFTMFKLAGVLLHVSVHLLLSWWIGMWGVLSAVVLLWLRVDVEKKKVTL